jgi:choline kinase
VERDGVKAIILAAGSGTRLGSLTADTPKCLLPINGRSLLDHQLEALAAVGITDVTVVAGHMADRVVAHVGGRCHVVRNDRYASTNSIVSLHAAADILRKNAFVVQNGDVLYSAGILKRLLGAPQANACLVDPLRPWTEGEYHVELREGRIIRYARAVPPAQSVGESAQSVKIGARDSAPFLDRIAQIIRSGGEHEFPNRAYDVLIGGGGLWPVYTAGLPWWEIDTPEDYARCRAEEARLSAPPAVGPWRERVRSWLRHPRVPWRCRQLAGALARGRRHPARTCRHLGAVRTGRLALDAFDLAVNGPRVLAQTLAVSAEVGLRPFLLWGSLLGCIREGGFIAGDRDIDLGVLEGDATRLAALRAAMARRGYDTRIQNDFKLSLVHPRHPRLFVDIDVVGRFRDGWAITNADADPARLFYYRFEHDVFAGVRTARFLDGMEVAVPNRPERFLEATYGDWRTPQAKVHYLYGPLNVEVEIRPLPSAVSPERDLA